MRSELADDVEVFVVGVLPGGGRAEVGVVQVLTSALGPPHRLHLVVAPEHRGLYTNTHR